MVKNILIHIIDTRLHSSHSVKAKVGAMWMFRSFMEKGFIIPKESAIVSNANKKLAVISLTDRDDKWSPDESFCPLPQK